MKRINSILLFLICSYSVFSQTNRVILLEHFTQASCAPSAIYNPIMQQYLDTLTAVDVILLQYQCPWPGVDPMNEQNPEDVSSRLDFYGIDGIFTGIPTSIIDGNYFFGGPMGFYNGEWGWTHQDMIDRSEIESPFDLGVTHTLLDNGNDQYSLSAQMNISVLQNYSSPLTAFFVIIEEKIQFNEPPGENGEITFYNVMRKFLPNANGISIDESLTTGSEIIKSQVWNFSTDDIYEPGMIGVIAFLQNTNTKEIIQVAYDSAQALSSYSIEPIQFIEPVDYVCSTTIGPVIKIQNKGKPNPDSVLVTYGFSTDTLMDSIWYNTANLNYFELDTINLFNQIVPEIDTDFHTFKVAINCPNYETGDTTTFIIEKTFEKAIESKRTVCLEIQLDNYGSETS